VVDGKGGGIVLAKFYRFGKFSNLGILVERSTRCAEETSLRIPAVVGILAILLVEWLRCASLLGCVSHDTRAAGSTDQGNNLFGKCSETE
jgi:hypothetical protein